MSSDGVASSLVKTDGSARKLSNAWKASKLHAASLKPLVMTLTQTTGRDANTEAHGAPFAKSGRWF